MFWNVIFIRREKGTNKKKTEKEEDEFKNH
jgi:hypothetical protein